MDGLYVIGDINVVKRLWLNVRLLTMTIILKGKSIEGVSNTVWDTFFMFHRQKYCGSLFESTFPDFHRKMEFSDGQVA